jgi:crotonobetainyl-CoA:carnitine CoA-transferase CaiB-like acyl-CoA transferase
MKPLAGVRLLTIEQFGAAPYGSLFLADLGAEVIKIENAATGGEASRSGGPFLLGENDSLYFQGWNTNKKSITLNLKSPEGQATLHRLVSEADAVMNNLRGDQPGKLGLTYETLGKFNPKIVCGHISAYGRDNSRAGRPGYDFLMQAEAGLMSITGDPDGDPARFGPSVIDFMTGMTLTVGLLSAIIGARTTGKGCDVDASLFDVALHQLNYSATWYLNAGFEVTRQPRSSHFSCTPAQTFKASDGWIFIMCLTENFWERLIEAIGHPELGKDERFATMEARYQNRAALTGILDGLFSTNTMAHWVEMLGAVIPIGPVYDVRQALESPFVAEVGMVETVPHPTDPQLKLLANPLRLDGKRLSLQVCSALGENNQEFRIPALATNGDASKSAIPASSQAVLDRG